MSQSTPEARLRAALELFELGEQMVRCRVRRERPHVTEPEVDAVVQRWLQERSGAVFGDYPGPPSGRVLGGATS